MTSPVLQFAAVALTLFSPELALSQDGALDSSFSGDGMALVEFGPAYPNSHTAEVEALPDGRIVAFGWGVDGVVTNPAAARFLVNGALDTSFSADGKVIFEYAGIPGGRVRGGRVRTDGKLVLGGHLTVAGEAEIGLARLTAAGLFDSAFGAAATPGSIHHPLPSGDIHFVEAVELQSDGKILVAGSGYASGFTDEDFFVARFTELGQVDTTFSGDGVAWIAFDHGGPNDDYLAAMVVQPDGKIVVAGSISGVLPDYDSGFARLLPSGSLDSTFDGDSGSGNGRVVWELTDLFGTAEDNLFNLALQSDGRILFSGYYSVPAGSQDFFGRLLGNGASDPALPFTSYDSGGNEILVQADGKIVVLGGAQVGSVGVCKVSRFDVNGTALDLTFGSAGSVLISNGPGLTTCNTAALSNGKIVVAGDYGVGGDADLLVARLRAAIFRNGFESGGSGYWSVVVP